jgi:hypothetical protein
MHTITHRLSWFWVLLLLVTLTACGASPSAAALTPTEVFIPTLTPETPLFELPTPPAKTPQPPEALWQSWLDNPSCRPPCWQGITPGTTSVKDAATILNRLPFTDNIQFGSLPSEERGLLVWRWAGSKDSWAGTEDKGSGSLGFSQQAASPIVSALSLVFHHTYHLHDIVAAYGEPTHVVPSMVSASIPHTDGQAIVYNLRLVYLSQGFFLQTEQSLLEPPRLGPKMALDGRVTFFEPGKAGLDTALKNFSNQPWRSADLLPWQGYEDFESYCRKARPREYKGYGQMCGRTSQ